MLRVPYFAKLGGGVGTAYLYLTKKAAKRRTASTGILILGLLLNLIPACAARAETTVQLQVLLSAQEETYQSFYSAFRQALAGRNPPVESSLGVLPAPVAQTGVLVAVGTEACQHSLQARDPVTVVCALVPRLSVDSVLAGATRATAVYIDQPLARQIALLRLALPAARRVGVIFGPASAVLAPTVRQALAEQGLELRATDYQLGDNIVHVLAGILKDTDVLLTLPDPVVYSRGNIYPFLLSTYRSGVPVIGFSSSFVRAGALLGVFSTPEQIGRQTAELAHGLVARSAVLPQPQYPKNFTVQVNDQVGRSLQLSIPSESLLQRRLQEAER